MSAVLDWSTGAALRATAREEAHYTPPHPLHAGAALLALASPVLATLLVVLTALLRT